MTKTFFMASAALLAAGVVSHASAAPPAAGAPATIVVVDSDRVLTDCTACKAANAQLQQQNQQLQARADQLAAPLRTEQTAIQTAVTALGGKQPDAALQQRITAFNARQDQARTTLQPLQDGLQRNASYVRQQIVQKLVPIVTSVMNAHRALAALDQRVTIAAAPTTDVTNEVLAQLNAQLPSVSVTAPAAPAAADGR